MSIPDGVKNILKYYVHASYQNNIGFYLQEVNIIKDINSSYVSALPKTIWLWGTIESLDKKTFYRRSQLYNTLPVAVEALYRRIDELNKILESRKRQAVENVVLAQEILAEEKKVARQAASDYKRYNNLLKNINIEKHLERSGIIIDEDCMPK